MRPPSALRRISALAFLALLGCAAPAAARPAGAPGEIVVTFAPGEPAERVASRYGAQVLGAIEETSTFKLSVPDVDAALARMRRDPSVRRAAPNGPVRRHQGVSFPHDDPTLLDDGAAAFADQLEPGGALASVGVAPAAVFARGVRGVTVAVLDTGVDASHEALAGRLWTNAAERDGATGWDDDADGAVDDLTGYDFVDGDTDPSEVGVEGTVVGHGTFIASLVAIAAPSATIMPLRVLDGNGVGSAFDAAAAIRFATRHGARVVSMSFGCDSARAPRVLADAIAYAESQGVVLVAAAGNDDRAPLPYPASDVRSVVSVGACDGDARAEFSNYGTDTVHVGAWAPGVDLVGAMPSAGDGASRYARWSGTSFATAVVAATAATVLAIHPGMKAADVRQVVSHVEGYDAVDGVRGWRVDMLDAAGRAARDAGALRVVSAAPLALPAGGRSGSVVLRSVLGASRSGEQLSVRATGLEAGAALTVSLVRPGSEVSVGVVRVGDGGEVAADFYRAVGATSLGLDGATGVLLRRTDGSVVLGASVGPSANALRSFVEVGLRYVGPATGDAPMPLAVARCGFDGDDAQSLEVDASARRPRARYELYLDGRRVGELAPSEGEDGAAARRIAFSTRPVDGTGTLPLPSTVSKVTKVGRVTVVERRRGGGSSVVYAGGLAAWAYVDAIE
jgi:hypothetical protein